MYTGRQNKKRKYQRYLLFCKLVPRTGLEPARLSTLAPETSASTIPPPGHSFRKKSGKRGSNSRPRPWQGRALPTELFPHLFLVKRRRLELPRHNCHYPLKVARLPIPPSLRDQSEVCPEQDSNLHVSQHSHLKRARLPFRHLGILSEEERKTRLELATPTLARSCSTN